MNQLEALEQQLRSAFPGSKSKIDKPIFDSGVWFLDIMLGTRNVVVQWQQGKPFGISADLEVLSAHPEQSASTQEDAFEQASALLKAVAS